MPTPEGTFTVREREAGLHALRVINQILTAKEVRSGAPRPAYMLAMHDMQLCIHQMMQAIAHELSEAGLKPDNLTYKDNSVPKPQSQLAAEAQVQAAGKPGVLGWGKSEVDEEIKRIAERFHMTAGGPDGKAEGTGTVSHGQDGSPE